MTNEVNYADLVKKALEREASLPKGDRLLDQAPVIQNIYENEAKVLESKKKESQAELQGLISQPDVTPDYAAMVRAKLDESEEKLSTYQTSRIPSQQYMQGQLQQRGFSGRVQEGEFGNTLTRLDLSFSNLDTEKKEKFLKKYPSGDFVVIPKQPDVGFQDSGQYDILVRTNPEQDFIKLDSDDWTLNDFFGDLGEDVPNIAVSLAMAASRGGVIKSMLKQFTGEGTTEIIEEQIETLRGFQKEELGEQAFNALIQASAAGVGERLSVLYTAPRNVSRGAGVSGVTPAGKKAMAAETLLKEKGYELPGLRVDQIASNPIIALLGKQSSAQTSALKNYEEQQSKAVMSALMNLRPKDVKRLFGDEITNLHDDALRDLRSYIKSPDVNLSELGSQAQQVIKSYDDVSRAVQERLYSKARKFGPAEYDLSYIDTVISELERGMRVPKVGSDEYLQLDSVSKEVADVIQQYKAIDFSQLGKQESARGELIDQTAVLKKLRSSLFYIKEQDTLGKPANVKASIEQARRLYSAINSSMKNPKNLSGEAAEAYQKADVFTRKYFDSIEELGLRNDMQGMDYYSLAKKYARPGNFDNINKLKTYIDEVNIAAKGEGLSGQTKWKKFQDAFAGNVASIENIKDLPQVLRSYNKEELDLLLSPDDFKSLTKMSKNIEILNQLDVEGVVARRSRAVNGFAELIESGNENAIKFLEKQAKGTQTDALRQASMDYLYQKSIYKDQAGNMFINEKAQEQALKTLRDTGAIRFLKKDDLTVVRRLARYSTVTKGSNDAGTSLQAASTAADIRELFSPKKGGVDAIITLAEAYGTAKVMTSTAARKLILGSGREKINPRNARALAAQASSQIAQSFLDMRQESIEDIEQVR